jgi:hypothetical protein
MLATRLGAIRGVKSVVLSREVTRVVPHDIGNGKRPCDHKSSQFLDCRPTFPCKIREEFLVIRNQVAKATTFPRTGLLS